MAEIDDGLVVNGVRFETKRGAMAAWMRIQGNSPDVLIEMLLLVKEQCPADLEAFTTVERAWAMKLGQWGGE